MSSPKPMSMSPKSSGSITVHYPKDFSHTALQKQMFQFIRTHPEIITPCNLRQKEVRLTKVLSKKTLSNTIQVLGDLNKSYNGIDGVFFKIFFGPSDYEFSKGIWDNSLQVEALIYEEVVNKLIFNNMTPHLIAFYGIVNVCKANEIATYLSPSNRQKFLTYVQQIESKEEYRIEDMYMLVLERTNGVPLDGCAKYQKYQQVIQYDVTWQEILFQVVWTLLCFKDARLMHNDLHEGNVFISLLPKKQKFIYYISQDEWYYMETNVFVQLYDFDNSAKMKKPGDAVFDFGFNNGKLSESMCFSYHFCNEYDEKIDITRFLYYVLTDPNAIASQIVINELCDINYLSKLQKGKYVWHGIPCVRQKDGSCRYEAPTDEQVKPLREMISVLGNLRGALGVDKMTLSQIIERYSNNITISALPSSFRNNAHSVKSIYSTARQ